MKAVSIKYFLSLVVVFLLLLEVGMSFNFLKNSKENIGSLLQENVQAKILTLRHFLEKNLQASNVNNIITFIDNAVLTSDIIKDVHIVNDKNHLVYSTDRDVYTMHPNLSCLNASAIKDADIYTQECYVFDVKLFSQLEPYYYKVYIYLDRSYIASLLDKQAKTYMVIFFSFVFVFFLFFWYLMQKQLINPLEKLKRFAKDKTQVPNRFWILELESIRQSLYNTFQKIKKEQDKLYKISTRDALTGLYNRYSLMEKLQWFIAKSNRDKKKFALLFIDLDDFKNINDSKGHEFGDVVLEKIAKILKETVRENDIVARFGGDEFVVILGDIEDEIIVTEIAQRINDYLTQPITHDGIYYNITASIGIAIYPKDGEDPSSLLKHADIAMYRSKEFGKNQYYFYAASMNKRIEEILHIQRLMEKGFEEGNFKLYYQPKVDVATQKILGCEALIRLDDPQEGLIAPWRFIPVAEQNGFIKKLGHWVLLEAVSQIQKWQNTPLSHLKVSINISAVQFQEHEQLLETLEKVATQIDPALLDIELTESAFMDNLQEKVDTIIAIKKLGFSFSLDDFGTGYSSLSYLKTIPFDTLKIDKSFIDDIQKDNNISFVKMIIKISKELELKVVAEGVEDKTTLKILRSMECDCYQGYLCSAPVPAEKFFHLVTTKNSV